MGKTALLDFLPTKPPKNLPRPDYIRPKTWKRMYGIAERFVASGSMTIAMKAMGYSESTCRETNRFYMSRMIDSGLLDYVRKQKQARIRVKADVSLEKLVDGLHPPTVQFISEQEHGKAMQKSHITVEEISVYHPVVDVTPAKSEGPPKQIEEK